jgi:hypothetical protein
MLVYDKPVSRSSLIGNEIDNGDGVVKPSLLDRQSWMGEILMGEGNLNESTSEDDVPMGLMGRLDSKRLKKYDGEQMSLNDSSFMVKKKV